MQYKDKKTIEEEIREKGASIIHDVWSHWQNYLHSKGKTISDENWERWERQKDTKYENLSEEEKESDRKIFDKFYADFIHQIRQEDKEYFDDKSAEMYKAGMDMAYKLVKEMIMNLPDKIYFDRENGSNAYIKGFGELEKNVILQNLDNLNKE